MRRRRWGGGARIGRVMSRGGEIGDVSMVGWWSLRFRFRFLSLFPIGCFSGLICLFRRFSPVVFPRYSTRVGSGGGGMDPF